MVKKHEVTRKFIIDNDIHPDTYAFEPNKKGAQGMRKTILNF